jgi:Ca-activated chloride channel homolog
MHFANPNMLWLLLVLPPALALFLWWSWRRRQQLLAQFIHARLLPGLLAGVSSRRYRWRSALLVAACACVVTALARPQWSFTWEEVKQRGLDIIVAIDTSRSMLAEDITPNRLARAKLAALDLMQQARSDRLGLIAFAGTAFLECPLTIDDVAFRQSVEALDTRTIPQGGTALAEAINTAVNSFKEGDNHRVLVIFTDGEDHDSGAVEAAQKAGETGLKIFTIGIGTPEGELLRIKTEQGGQDFVRDEQGNVVKSHLNEALLREIAGATPGGFYLPLRGAKAIDTLYAQGLAPLPKTSSQERLVKRYNERFQWPLGLAALLLVAEMFFPERRRSPQSVRAPASVPQSAPASARSPARAAATILIALLVPCVSNTASGSPTSALRDYRSGKYGRALKEYEQALQKNPDDPRLQFNAGTAAYRGRQFEQALKHFDQAVNAPDLHQQELGYYNRGNTRYFLGEQAMDPAKRSENWQKAIQDFDSSLKLNPNDTDAKYNQEFVKRRLEELKQQQQQNNKDQNKDKNQDQQDQQQQDQQKQNQQQQQQQANQNQQQQNQQSGQQQPNQQPQQNQQQAQQQQSQQQNDQQKQQEEARKKEEQQKQQQQAQAQKTNAAPNQPKPAPGEQPKQEPAEQEQAFAGQMTPDQARQILDAQKGDEQMLVLKPEGKPQDQQRPLKDW